MTASAKAGAIRRVEWCREASSVVLPAKGASLVGSHQPKSRWPIGDAIGAVDAAPVRRRRIWNLGPSARRRVARAGVMGDHVVSGEAADGRLTMP
jgi:hypothetical protein